MGTIESIIGKLRIQQLKTHIESSRLYSEALARQFQEAQTGAEKTMIAGQYEEALKQVYKMRLLLELLERKDKEASSRAATHC